MKHIILFFSAITFLNLAGCTTALEKQCKETNWFEHGHKIAMSGKRLNSDSFPQQCEKEKVPVSYSEMDLGFKAGMANYCKPDVAHQTGKNGDPLNLELCSTSDYSILRTRHREGVVIFCQANNGFPFGSTGKVYSGVCPKNLEPAFLKEYRRGRKVFVVQQIAGKESELQQIDSEITDLNSKRASVKQEIQSLSSTKVITRDQQYSANGVRETIQVKEADETRQQKQNLEWEVSRIDNDIREKRTQQQNIRSEIVKLKTEAAGLE
jgi:hypothetical protein